MDEYRPQLQKQPQRGKMCILWPHYKKRWSTTITTGRKRMRETKNNVDTTSGREKLEYTEWDGDPWQLTCTHSRRHVKRENLACVLLRWHVKPEWRWQKWLQDDITPSYSSTIDGRTDRRSATCRGWKGPDRQEDSYVAHLKVRTSLFDIIYSYFCCSNWFSFGNVQ